MKQYILLFFIIVQSCKQSNNCDFFCGSSFCSDMVYISFDSGFNGNHVLVKDQNENILFDEILNTDETTNSAYFFKIKKSEFILFLEIDSNKYGPLNFNRSTLEFIIVNNFENNVSIDYVKDLSCLD